MPRSVNAASIASMIKSNAFTLYVYEKQTLRTEGYQISLFQKRAKRKDFGLYESPALGWRLGKQRGNSYGNVFLLQCEILFQQPFNPAAFSW